MKLIYTSEIRRGFETLSELVSSAVEDGGAWVVIPDQMAVTVEDALSRSLSPSSQLMYDVVSFRRLADNIFRKLGGVSYRYADRAAEVVTMWRTLRALSDEGVLLHYGSSVTPDMASSMLSAVEELKQSMVSPEELMTAALKLSGAGDESNVPGEPTVSGGTATEKYIDIANIYESYNELLAESYDDRLSIISSAAKRVRGSDFFKKTHVILFSFSGFTAQQMSMIGEMTAAKSLSFIFTVPGDGDDVGKRHDFDGIAEVRRRLHMTASRMGVGFEIVCDRERECESADGTPGVRELADALWGAEPLLSNETPSAISLCEAPSRRREAEAAAIRISRAIRSGLRFRDIAVCTGSVESYRGIIDAVFDDYGIPYHMSYRAPVERMRKTAALLGALRVISSGWRLDDVIAYVKTGLSGINADAEDELELYMTTWNISGRRFYDPDGGAWSMNPDGYTADWTDEGVELLAGVNESRRIVSEPLLRLAEAFSDSTDSAAKTEAVREFLLQLDENDAARSCGSESESDGDINYGGGDERDENIAAIVTDALSAVHNVPGAISAQDYVSCLKLVLETLSVGAIPSRTDEVQISDTIGMRCGSGDGYALVIMLGCADGELPAYGSDGFFSESERAAFESVGVTVGESGDYKAAMELYNFNRCMCMGKSVMFTFRTPEGGVLPSVIERIKKLLPKVKHERFEGVRELDDIYSASGAALCFSRLADAEMRLAVREALADIPSSGRMLAGFDIPISASYETVSEDTAARIFGGNIRFTQSRLESFVSCKFGFYCSYVLGLRERKRARLDYADIGIFIHEVLEKIFSSGLIEGKADDETLEREADKVIADYIARACPRGEVTLRQAGLFRRLRRSVLVFLRTFRREFAQSRFRPVLFEVPFGIGGNADSMMPMKISLGDGSYATLSGIADRVDTYRDADGRLYVRVIDYKTGQKSFSPGDIADGKNLQLPLYLYTICSDKSERNLRALGGSPGDILVPAGFLYIGVRPSDTDADAAEIAGTDGVGGAENSGSAGADISESSRRLQRRGILLADESVLRAMDAELSGEFIPVRFKSDGSPYADSIRSLASESDLSGIFDELVGTVRRIAAEARAGRAETNAESDSCEHCAARAVCRRRM